MNTNQENADFELLELATKYLRESATPAGPTRELVMESFAAMEREARPSITLGSDAGDCGGVAASGWRMAVAWTRRRSGVGVCRRHAAGFTNHDFGSDGDQQPGRSCSSAIGKN